MLFGSCHLILFGLLTLCSTAVLLYASVQPCIATCIVEKAPLPSISNVVRILSFDTIWPPHPLHVCSALEFNHALQRVLAVHLQTALSLNQCEFCPVESQSTVDPWSCSVLTCADSTYQFVCSSITLLQLQPLLEYVWMTICPLLYCFVITKDLQMGTLLKAS